MGISEGSGLSISVHRGEIETIEKNQDKGIGVTVFVGKKRGNATTSDFSQESLKQTVEAAYNIATFTSEDEAAVCRMQICLNAIPLISDCITVGPSIRKKLLNCKTLRSRGL